MNINYKLSNSTLHDEKSKAQKKQTNKNKIKKRERKQEQDKKLNVETLQCCMHFL